MRKFNILSKSIIGVFYIFFLFQINLCAMDNNDDDIGNARALRLSIHSSLYQEHSLIMEMRNDIRTRGFWNKLHDFTKPLSTLTDIVGGSIIGITSIAELTTRTDSDNLDRTHMCFGFLIAAIKGVDYYIDRKLQRAIVAHTDLPRRIDSCLNIASTKFGSQFNNNRIRLAVESYLNTDESNLDNWINTGR